MSFIKRDSITGLINSLGYTTDDAQNTDVPIGKVISRPTKSIFIRHGTKQQQIIDLETQLRHAHMQLSAERARVEEMEGTLKTMINEKFTNQSNIISKLQDSQNALRSQLQMVIQSKMDLCEETAKEIDRLRKVIKNGKFNAYVPVINNDINSNGKKNFNNNRNNMIGLGSDEEKDNFELLSFLDDSDNPFPHCDSSKIDLRILSNGDGKTLPNPFASVDLQYTGYIVDSKNPRDRTKWVRFIDESTSKTIFETKLGNNENIIGLEQAVLSMSLGERAIVWVPSRLGYGTHGAPNLIPPNADIVFELTLVSIQNDNEIEMEMDMENEIEDDIDAEMNDMNDMNDMNGMINDINETDDDMNMNMNGMNINNEYSNNTNNIDPNNMNNINQNGNYDENWN